MSAKFYFTNEETGKSRSYENFETIYDVVEPIAGEDEAIEASSWCELAVIGDEYDGDGFTIEVIEED